MAPAVSCARLERQLGAELHLARAADGVLDDADAGCGKRAGYVVVAIEVRRRHVVLRSVEACGVGDVKDVYIESEYEVLSESCALSQRHICAFLKVSAGDVA